MGANNALQQVIPPWIIMDKRRDTCGLRISHASLCREDTLSHRHLTYLYQLPATCYLLLRNLFSPSSGT